MTRRPTSLLLLWGCLSRYVRVTSEPPRGFRIVVAWTSAGGPSNPRFAQIRSATLHRPTSSSTYYLHHTAVQAVSAALCSPTSAGEPSVDTSNPKRPSARVLSSFVFLDTTGTGSAWCPRQRASYSSRERSSCLLTLTTARTARTRVPRRQSLPGRGDRSDPASATSFRRSGAAGTCGR